MDPFVGRWSWCDLCQCARIQCPVCEIYSCTGGGCAACTADFDEAIRMVREGTAPTKAELSKN